MTRSRLKVAIVLVSCLAAFVCVEGVVRVFGLFGLSRTAVEVAANSHAEAEEPKRLGRLLHPYRGWMSRPGGRASFLKKDKAFFPGDAYTEWALANSTVNDFGYLSQVEDYRDVTPEQFVIGVFGGSVASQLAVMGGDAIRRGVVERRPDLAGKVIILNCASGAYKQPQQLFALEELLLLGVPFDVVVNVDGVNELVFGARDARNGYHPILPSRGQYRSLMDLNSSDPTVEAILTTAVIHRHRQAVTILSRVARESIVIRNSEFLKAIVGMLIRQHERAAIKSEAEYQAHALVKDSLSITALMRDPCMGPNGDCSELVASLWERGSRLMAAAADQMGARYIHVLQPNQYVEDSKRLTPNEKLTAYDERSVFSKEVRKGYPLLRERGKEMTREGVSVHDLSMIFRNQREAIYVDTCCHYNYSGNQILGEAVATLITNPEGLQ